MFRHCAPVPRSTPTLEFDSTESANTLDCKARSKLGGFEDKQIYTTQSVPVLVRTPVARLHCCPLANSSLLGSKIKATLVQRLPLPLTN